MQGCSRLRRPRNRSIGISNNGNLTSVSNAAVLTEKVCRTKMVLGLSIPLSTLPLSFLRYPLIFRDSSGLSGSLFGGRFGFTGLGFATSAIGVDVQHNGMLRMRTFLRSEAAEFLQDRRLLGCVASTRTDQDDHLPDPTRLVRLRSRGLMFHVDLSIRNGLTCRSAFHRLAYPTLQMLAFDLYR